MSMHVLLVCRSPLYFNVNINVKLQDGGGGRLPLGNLTEARVKFPTPQQLVNVKWGGGTGGRNLPPPVPWNPSSCPFFLDFLPFAPFRLIFPIFLPLSALLELPPPALSSPASHTPSAPYSPGLPPPCPPPPHCQISAPRK